MFEHFFAGGPLDFERNSSFIAEVAAVVLANVDPSLADHLHRLRREGPCPAMLVDGLPELANRPPTPRSTAHLPDENAMMPTDAMLAGIFRLLGLRTFAVSSENHGRLVRNVVPRWGAETERSSHGSKVDLSWHTDNGNVAQPPQFLGFVCIRNSEMVPTELVFADGVAAALQAHSPDAHSALQDPAFDFCPPQSHDKDTPCLKGRPVLSYDDAQKAHFRFNRDVVRGRSKWHDTALKTLSEVLASANLVAVVMVPGQIAIWDNTRVFHRRPRFDPDPHQARWLRRQFAEPDVQ